LARCLIIGCGCRGRSLAGALIEQGHAVRGTTRAAERLPLLEAAGVEAFLGDPDRVATIAPGFEHVSVACVLLGSAAGAAERLEALHGTRLEMMLSRMVDTTVRGVLYEAAGTVEERLLSRGARLVAAACSDSHTPYALLEADPAEPGAWLHDATGLVESLLRGGGGEPGIATSCG
jgi:NADP-dependent 3-hydroxy acid dehydrogenase YdfG